MHKAVLSLRSVRICPHHVNHARCLLRAGRCHAQHPLHIRLSHQSAESRGFLGALLNYFRRLKWVPIPLGVGFAYVSYQQFGHVVKREELKLAASTDPEDIIVNDWVVMLYKALPLKILSRAWGRINGVELPVWMREPLYKFYIWTFDCDLEEAAIRDLTHYKNLGEFFKRRLRHGVRKIDPNHALTSPCDGRILHFGRAERGNLEQVKGINYSVQDFLGPQTWPDGDQRNMALSLQRDPSNQCDPREKLRLPKAVYHNKLVKDDKNELYHCVIYLAPGDYHGFHSPTDWSISYRRHFPGELFSVNPGIARLVRNLFTFNERAVYVGCWEAGFFSMTAVGATNVGSIRVYHDKEMQTNSPGNSPMGKFHDECFSRQDLPGLPMKKGESFGEFNLGSTIVLVFEAPRQFEFKIQAGQHIKMGEMLGCFKNIKAKSLSGS